MIRGLLPGRACGCCTASHLRLCTAPYTRALFNLGALIPGADGSDVRSTNTKKLESLPDSQSRLLSSSQFLPGAEISSQAGRSNNSLLSIDLSSAQLTFFVMSASIIVLTPNITPNLRKCLVLLRNRWKLYMARQGLLTDGSGTNRAELTHHVPVHSETLSRENRATAPNHRAAVCSQANAPLAALQRA